MRVQPNRDYVSNDDIQTPVGLAGWIVNYFNPTDMLLEPCAGGEFFLRPLPDAE